MQDRVKGKVTREDNNLSLQQAYLMTDWTDEEMDQLASLEVGQEMFLGSECNPISEDNRIRILRTA